MLAALIVAAGAWAYSTSFRGVFVLDDVRAIVRNPTIRIALAAVDSALASFGVDRRRPARRQPVVRHQLRRSGLVARPAADSIDPRRSTPGTCSSTWPPRWSCSASSAGRCSSPRLRAGFGSAAPWLALAIALVWVVHPAPDRGGDVRRAAGRVADGALLPADALLRDPGVRRRREAEPGRRQRSSVAPAAWRRRRSMVTAPIVVALWDRLLRRQPDRRDAGRDRLAADRRASPPRGWCSGSSSPASTAGRRSSLDPGRRSGRTC